MIEYEWKRDWLKGWQAAKGIKHSSCHLRRAPYPGPSVPLLSFYMRMNGKQSHSRNHHHRRAICDIGFTFSLIFSNLSSLPDECVYGSLFIIFIHRLVSTVAETDLHCHLHTSRGAPGVQLKSCQSGEKQPLCRRVSTAVALSERDLYTLLCYSSARNCWLMALWSTK